MRGQSLFDWLSLKIERCQMRI